MVVPFKTPLKMRGKSASLREVEVLSLPGALRAISRSISCISSLIPAGSPSTTQPIAEPWLSPNTESLIFSPVIEDKCFSSHAVVIIKK